MDLIVLVLLGLLGLSVGLMFYSGQMRLAVMMFLEFFIWGAWYVTVGNYMGEIGMTEEIYWVYTVNPIAAIVAPFFLGFIADRYFATEKVLGVLHLLGAVFIFFAPTFAERGSSFGFLTMMLLYNLCYMPTLGLVNALAFHHITDQENQFPRIRVLGTVGWIVAGVLVSGVLNADLTALPLQVTALASVVLGIFAFFLPHTPPPAAGKKASVREIIGLDALARLNSRSFSVFIICSMLMCIALAAYYSYAPVYVNAAGLEDPGFKMTFGQMSEVVFMLLMPFFFVRLGVKWMLLMGMLAWVARYALFALAAPAGVVWMIIGGIILHGICYDFFFVTGQIYVDKRSTADIRGQAQGFLVLVTYGIGLGAGALIAGPIFNAIVGEGGTLYDWQQFWIFPATVAAVVFVIFALFFKDDSAAVEKERRQAA